MAGSQHSGQDRRRRRSTSHHTDGRGPHAVAGAVVVSPSPSEIRALAFAASLGPVTSPRSRPEVDGVIIDLAGEEALLEYLAELAPAAARD